MRKLIADEQQSEAPQEVASVTLPSRLRSWVVRPTHALAIVLLLVAASYRLLLLARGWPALDSDEGVVGLVARSIWLHGAHPLFFWGEHYMGAFESYFAVPFFMLLGSSDFSLHLSVVVLTLCFFVAMYAVGRAAYGRIVGLLVLGWLALGPLVGIQRELMAGGGYQEILLLGAVILLCVWERLRQAARVPGSRGDWLRCIGVYAIIGTSAGLALWSDLLILPTVLIAVGVLCVARPREICSRAGIVLALCFVLSIFPFVHYNLTHQFISYTEAAEQGNSGNASSLTLTSANIVQRSKATLAISLPATFGSPRVCGTTDTAMSIGFIVHNDAGSSVCTHANEVFSLSLLALYALVAYQLLCAGISWLRRRIRHFQAAGEESQITVPAQPVGDAQIPGITQGMAQPAQLWLRFMLLAGALATLFAYLLGSRSAVIPLSAARYLLPMYLSVPLLLGTLWAFASKLDPRLARHGAAGRLGGWRSSARHHAATTRAVVAAGFIVLMFALCLYDMRLMLWASSDTRAFANPMPPSDRQVLAFMDSHHIHTYCGADYWVTYRLIFESHERVQGAMCGPTSAPPLQVTIGNRYLPYVQAVRANPRSAYITYASAAEAAAFATSDLPRQGYFRAVTGEYAIYYQQ